MQDLDDVAAAILASSGPVDAMKLQKLVYYCQAWHLAIMATPLFADDIEAWKDGPVVKDLWEHHKGARFVSSWERGNRHELPYETQQFVELVCAEYGPLTRRELSQRAHEEPPWKVVRGDLAPEVGSRRVIPHSIMAEYYRGEMLGGHTGSDLAVGGIMLTPRPSEVDELGLNDELARLRDEYRNDPEAHPNGSHPVIGLGQTERPSLEDMRNVVRHPSRSRH